LPGHERDPPRLPDHRADRGAGRRAPARANADGAVHPRPDRVLPRDRLLPVPDVARPARGDLDVVEPLARGLLRLGGAAGRERGSAVLHNGRQRLEYHRVSSWVRLRWLRHMATLARRAVVRLLSAIRFQYGSSVN